MAVTIHHELTTAAAHSSEQENVASSYATCDVTATYVHVATAASAAAQEPEVTPKSADAVRTQLVVSLGVTCEREVRIR